MQTFLAQNAKNSLQIVFSAARLLGGFLEKLDARRLREYIQFLFDILYSANQQLDELLNSLLASSSDDLCHGATQPRHQACQTVGKKKRGSGKP